MTASFAKKASQLNTPEYHTVRQLRLDNPGMKIEKAIRKTPSNQPMNATFAQMEGFIAKCANSEERLDVFEKIKALSKIQASPYRPSLELWFLALLAQWQELMAKQRKSIAVLTVALLFLSLWIQSPRRRLILS